jgi:hypothetical protein
MVVIDNLQQQQRALLMQVLQLSDADIAALPPGQQEQVRQLVRNLNCLRHDFIIILTFYLYRNLPFVETTNLNVTNMSIIITHPDRMNIIKLYLENKMAGLLSSVFNILSLFCPFFKLGLTL